MRIDRRRKLHATVLLKALGYGAEELLDLLLHAPETITIDGQERSSTKVEDLLAGRSARDRDPSSQTGNADRQGGPQVHAGRGPQAARGRHRVDPDRRGSRTWCREDGVKRVAPEDIVDERPARCCSSCNEEITEEILEEIMPKRKITEFELLYLDPITSTGTAIHDTLVADKTMTREEAIIDIYRRLRPGDPPTIETATTVFNNLFFNADRYDLSRSGA